MLRRNWQLRSGEGMVKQRRGRRGIQRARRTAVIRRIRFIVEPLGRGEIYPCSPQVVHRTLTELPCDDRYLERIRAIRFLSRKKIRDVRQRGWSTSTNYWTGTIKIFSWPARLWWWQGKRMPRNRRWLWLLFRYRGVVVRTKDGWWSGFWDREDVERLFVEYLLPHEVGHLIRDAKGWSLRRAERTANGFLGYLARRRAQRLSAQGGRAAKASAS